VAAAVTDSVVEQVYDKLKQMSVGYDFKPGERLNEGVLASALGVSRTPLREALTRLTTEGLLRFSPGKGFFCRDLDAQEVFSLYEMRRIVETEALRL
jgi:DNA-binding GntR family transcriptional regulator